MIYIKTFHISYDLNLLARSCDINTSEGIYSYIYNFNINELLSIEGCRKDIKYAVLLEFDEKTELFLFYCHNFEDIIYEHY